jgi:hypothetical protein
MKRLKHDESLRRYDVAEDDRLPIIPLGSKLVPLLRILKARGLDPDLLRAKSKAKPDDILANAEKKMLERLDSNALVE